MNFGKSLVFLLFVSLCFAVPQLTSEQFHSQLASEKPFIIKFFSPNCGHCVAMAPEYQKLWQNSKNSGYDVFQVDCTTQESLCRANEVDRFPSLKLFYKGISFNYNGARTQEAMNNWLNDVVSSDLVELSAEQIGKKRQTENFVLVGGLGESSRKIIAIAAKLSTYTSVNIYYFKQSNFIRLFKASTREYIDYQTDQNFPKSLIQWAFTNSRENILTLDDSSMNYVKEQNSFSKFLGIIQDKELTQIQEKAVNDFCYDNFKKILCFSLDKSSNVYANIQDTLKILKGENKVILVNSNFDKGYHYPHEEISLQKLTNFVKDASQNKLQLIIDAQRDIKQRMKFINVVKLTKQTFDKTIAQKQFVFVEFYSTTCGHCIKFAASYERVASHFKNQPNVVIAGVDVQEQNQLRLRENVQGFPQFRLYIRGNLVYYKRTRDADAMIQFITEAITTKIKEVSCTCAINVPRPYITIQGIDNRSYLNMLPALFKKYPIFILKDHPQFKIKVYKHNVKQYTGAHDIWAIADFLQIQTSPVLVKLGESQPSRKLQKALIDKKPILTVINKLELDTVSHIISLLQTYCRDIDEFVCGSLHKGDEDYDHLINELREESSEGNSLYWINLMENHYQKYQGDLEDITEEYLNDFVQAMKQYDNPQRFEEEESAQSSQEQL